MIKDKLITVTTYGSSVEAHMAKNKLESEGIMVFLFAENLSSLYPLYNVAVGGIKLKTLASDAEKAFAVLTSVSDQPFTTELNESVECPRCGSTDLEYAYESSNKVKSFFGFLLALVTFTLPLLSKNEYQCGNCGLVFRPAKEAKAL